MARVAVDFTGVNDQPEGELLIHIEKAEVKDSQSGNPMVALQCKVVAAENDRWVGHRVFPFLMLATDMKRQTFQALDALGLDVPEGTFDFDTDELIDKETWVYAVSKDSPKGQGRMTQVQRWGITPTAAKASVA
jgi:hypothetical protein